MPCGKAASASEPLLGPSAWAAFLALLLRTGPHTPFSKRVFLAFLKLNIGFGSVLRKAKFLDLLRVPGSGLGQEQNHLPVAGLKPWNLYGGCGFVFTMLRRQALERLVFKLFWERS